MRATVARANDKYANGTKRQIIAQRQIGQHKSYGSTATANQIRYGYDNKDGKCGRRRRRQRRQMGGGRQQRWDDENTVTNSISTYGSSRAVTVLTSYKFTTNYGNKSHTTNSKSLRHGTNQVERQILQIFTFRISTSTQFTHHHAAQIYTIYDGTHGCRSSTRATNINARYSANFTDIMRARHAFVSRYRDSARRKRRADDRARQCQRQFGTRARARQSRAAATRAAHQYR